MTTPKLNPRTVDRLNRQAEAELDAERVARQRESFDELLVAEAATAAALPELREAAAKAKAKLERAQEAAQKAAADFRMADGSLKQREFRGRSTRDRLAMRVQQESPECLNEFISELAGLQWRARNSFATGDMPTGKWNPISGPEKTKISNGTLIGAFCERCDVARVRAEGAQLKPMSATDAEALVNELREAIGTWHDRAATKRGIGMNDEVQQLEAAEKD